MSACPNDSMNCDACTVYCACNTCREPSGKGGLIGPLDFVIFIAPLSCLRSGEAIGAFLIHFDIKPTRTVLFEEIDITPDGIMSLDMTKTTVVSRGSR